MTTNAERFLAQYIKELTIEHNAYPERYTYGIEKVPEVAAKMVRALQERGGAVGTPALKRTCDALGVKQQISALALYLKA